MMKNPIHKMLQTGRFWLLAWGCFGLISCANQNGPETSDAADAQPRERIKSGDLFDDDSLKIAEKYGSINPLFSGERSQRVKEAGQVNQHFTGEFGKSDFKPSSYEKKSFWGSKEYAKKGFRDGADGSRFLQSAREGSRVNRHADRAFRESDRQHNRGRTIDGDARESRSSGISRTQDAETAERRRVFTPPEIRRAGKKRALSVEETRELLGR